MKILFIASRFPYPLIQGDRIRAYHQLRLLSRHHRVTLVTPVENARDREGVGAIRGFCEQIEAIPVSRSRRMLHLAAGLFTPLPWQTVYFCDSRFRRRTEMLMRTHCYDLVHVQLVRLGPAAEGIGGIPKIIDFIDALSLNWRNRSQREIAPLSWLTGWEAERLRRYEHALLHVYDRALVCSEGDRAAIGSYPNLDVVPQGIDIDAFPYAENPREPRTLLFTGRMGYFPNADAAIWFATQVFPLVRSRVADARFVIVGGNAPPRVRRLNEIPGVEVRDFTPRIHELLARSTLSVCPMRSGSGMQFKVLEAMASGAPVVATPRALGGIDAIDGEHVLVGPDRSALAHAVLRLLEDPRLRTRVARNARRLIEERYTWHRSVELLEAVYRKSLLQGEAALG